MEGISDEVLEVARNLFDGGDIDYNIDRYGKATVNTEELPDLDNYEYTYGTTRAEILQQAIDLIVKILPNVTFYNDYNDTGIYLELSDNHTFWDINEPEGFDGEFDYDLYNFFVEQAFDEFENQTGVELYQCGRSGRHICVEVNFDNILNYDNLCKTQAELEQQVIGEAESNCFGQALEEAKELAPDEKVAKCLSCGMKIKYKNRDVQHDAMGDYLECPNCHSTFDVDYDNIASIINEGLSQKAKEELIQNAVIPEIVDILIDGSRHGKSLDDKKVDYVTSDRVLSANEFDKIVTTAKELISSNKQLTRSELYLKVASVLNSSKKTEAKSDAEIVNETSKYLVDNGVYAEVDIVDGDIILNIPWGDWKHDHQRADYLMKQKGYVLEREEVTEEDGSDTYSAMRYYVPIGKGIKVEATDSADDIYNKLPNTLKNYLKNTDNVPTKEIDGTLWFNVTAEEKEQLENFVQAVDTIPESAWRNWDEKTKLDISSYANNANRICKNCVLVKEGKALKIEAEDYSVFKPAGKVLSGNKGLSEKEIDEIRRSLPNSFKDMTDEQKQIWKELSLRGMVMSCLVYDEDIHTSTVMNAVSKYYKQPYVNEYYDTLGKDVTEEIIKQQTEYFNKGKVIKDVGTDSDGLSYNSFVEPKDESKKVTEAEDMTQVKDDIETAVEKSDSTDLEKDQVKGSIDVLKTDEESAIEGYEDFKAETEKVADKELADAVNDQMQEIVDDEKEHIEKLDTIKSALGESKEARLTGYDGYGSVAQGVEKKIEAKVNKSLNIDRLDTDPQGELTDYLWALYDSVDDSTEEGYNTFKTGLDKVVNTVKDVLGNTLYVHEEVEDDFTYYSYKGADKISIDVEYYEQIGPFMFYIPKELNEGKKIESKKVKTESTDLFIKSASDNGATDEEISKLLNDLYQDESGAYRNIAGKYYIIKEFKKSRKYGLVTSYIEDVTNEYSENGEYYSIGTMNFGSAKHYNSKSEAERDCEILKKIYPKLSYQIIGIDDLHITERVDFRPVKESKKVKTESAPADVIEYFGMQDNTDEKFKNNVAKEYKTLRAKYPDKEMILNGDFGTYLGTEKATPVEKGKYITVYESKEVKTEKMGKDADKKYSNLYKYKGKAFAYDNENAIVEYVYVDPEDNSWIVLDEIGLSNDNWDNKEARDEYLDEYIAQLDDEANRLADDFIANEYLGESLANRYVKTETKADDEKLAMEPDLMESLTKSLKNKLDFTEADLDILKLMYKRLDNLVNDVYDNRNADDIDVKISTILEKADVKVNSLPYVTTVNEGFNLALAVRGVVGKFLESKFGYDFYYESKSIKTEASEGTATLDAHTDLLPIINMYQYDLYNMCDDLVPPPNADMSKDVDEAMLDIAEPIIETEIKGVLPSAKITFKEYEHPKYYKLFSNLNDVLYFDITYNVAEYEALKEKAIKDPEFEQYLKDHYKSYDGFMSFFADNLTAFNQQEEWKQFVSVLSYYLPNDDEQNYNTLLSDTYDKLLEMGYEPVDSIVDGLVDNITDRANDGEMTLNKDTVTQYIKELYGDVDQYDYILDEVLNGLSLSESKKVTEAEVTTATKSAGEYWVGDPCYVVPDDIYQGIWGDKYKFEDGTIDCGNGLSFQVHGTAWGDGEYKGSNGFIYGVDAGVLAIVPMELATKERGLDKGTRHKSSTAKLEYKDGVFNMIFDNETITINTDPSEDLDESKQLKKEDYEVRQDYYDPETGEAVRNEYVMSFDTWEEAQRFADGLAQDPNCTAWVNDTSKDESKKIEDKELLTENDEIPVVNPDEQDYYNNKGYIISLYPRSRSNVSII